ncbi:DUF6209 family protein [Pyxidicoccus sp. 3LG]
MSNRIGRPTFTPTPPTVATQDRAVRPSGGEKPAAARAQVDQFDSRATRPGAPRLTSTLAPTPIPSKAAALQPEVHGASAYEAHFGTGSRTAKALVEGQGQVALPTGPGRGPSFHAEAGKPLSVTVDPARLSKSTEKAELVWRMVPGGTEVAIPLTDGTRNADGRLNTVPAKIDVPEDAFGLLRISIRTTDASGRVSNQWDPSSDAAIAPAEGATVTFSDDWKTQVDGKLRAGDKLQLAYDKDRLTELLGGKVPSDVVACVSFNGEPPIEVPLTIQPGEGGKPGEMFMPSLKVPLEATEMTLWFKGQGEGSTGWDSSFGQNFKFKVGHARDDADPSWKAEMLRSTSFPNLKEEDFVGIGPSSQRYNCIAWTMGIQDQWVWPGTKVEDFDKLYATQGYKPMSELDLSNDPNLEKIVVYGRELTTRKGQIEVTHGALMDEQGRLTSKIGTQPLIRHNSADDLTGPSYGEPVRVYVRPRQPAVNNS